MHLFIQKKIEKYCVIVGANAALWMLAKYTCSEMGAFHLFSDAVSDGTVTND